MPKPDRSVLGPVTVKVTPNQLDIDASVSLTGKAVQISGNPAPLAKAIRMCRPGSDPVIEVAGDLPGRLVLGGGDNPFAKDTAANWGQWPMRLAILGKEGTDPIISGLQIRSKLQGKDVPGVSDLWMEGLTLQTYWGSSTPMVLFKQERAGLIRVFDSHFRAEPGRATQGDYRGFGYKFGIRAEGRARYQLSGLSFDPVQEHCLYLDSPQGDTTIQDIEHNGSTRTAVQIANRPFFNPGPSGFGNLKIENIRGRNLWGSGGSLVTVAGHPGTIYIKDILLEQGEESGCHGAVVVWANTDPLHGVHLISGRARDNVFANGFCRIEGVQVNAPGMDRSAIQVSGAMRVGIKGFNFETKMRYPQIALDTPFSKTRFDDEAAYLDGLPAMVTADCLNGRTNIDPVDFGGNLPQYPGWGPSGMRVSQAGGDLPDAEILKRYAPRKKLRDRRNLDTSARGVIRTEGKIDR